MSQITSKEIIKGNLLSPLPIILVGSVIKEKPNFLVIGYSAPFDFGKYTFISLYKKRYTRIGIHEHQTFSINIPSVNLILETNICGSKSGYKFDKSKLSTIFYGEIKTAPMIQEYPITMELKVAEIIDYGRNEGIIGEVINSYANPECVSNGKLDMRKVNPILWATGGDNNYYSLGKRIEIPDV
jgi:flavin reductase (DIM6/NTAB) family NADH-FMN oxidoreductase RutF